jgi:hypothetical protein
MHGSPFVFMAEIAIPDARQCIAWAAPFLVVGAAVCVLRRMDSIVDHLFPHWNWEKSLGWLNITAQRRAERVLRWLGYFVYAVLGLALFGIVWSAKELASISDWSDSSVVPKLALCVPVILACLGFWLVYLGCELIPKLRGQYEEESLEKFRAEQYELERERDMNPSSRVKSPLHKPRLDSSTAPNRIRPRR